MDHNDNCKGWLGKGSIVLGLGLLVFGAIFYSTGGGTKTSTKPAAAPLDRNAQRPVRIMNMALGPMVFLARELDFTVKNAKGDILDDSPIATRVENQLLGLRDLYRQEIAKNTKLVGSLILQLTITPAGEVIQVKEVSGRINDAEFKKTVAVEIAKWTLRHPDSRTRNCSVPTAVRSGGHGHHNLGSLGKLVDRCGAEKRDCRRRDPC